MYGAYWKDSKQNKYYLNLHSRTLQAEAYMKWRIDTKPEIGLHTFQLCIWGDGQLNFN